MTDETAKSARVTLSDEWRDWLVANLIAGAPPNALEEQLRAWGAPADVAASEIQRFSEPGVLEFLTRERQRPTWEALVVALQRSHLEMTSAAIAKIEWPAADIFFSEYYARNRPVVFRDLVAQWGIRDWTMPRLRDRFGDTIITACMNREASKTPDRDFDKHQVQIALGTFIDQVTEQSHSNDLYLIANNHALRNTALQALLEEVILDEHVFAPEQLPGGCSLWIGPAGTITPLHHDVSNILFGQVQGRKRITLIPPHYIDRFQWDSFYAYPEHPPFADVPQFVVELEPGEALFIPAGWLHHVEALEASVNFSLLCFRRPNSFSWFVPGALKT